MSTNSKSQGKQQAVTSRTATKSKKATVAEEAHMRKVSLYYVIGFSVVSSAALISVHSFEATFISITAWLCFYRILCYLFPTHEGPHPLITFLRIFGKHP